MKPRLLDLFCGAGGATRGYQLAGFHVTGVDIRPQPHYVGDEFIRADAMEILPDGSWFTSHEPFDAIHASPPCQAYSVTRHSHMKTHPALLEPVRENLAATGLPYIIENVVGAPLATVVELCGASFRLEAVDTDGALLVLRRHRLFESNVMLMQLPCACREYRRRGVRVGGVYGGGPSNRKKSWARGGYTPPHAVRAALMGVDWMTQKELCEAIPPVYTAWLGEQLMAYVKAAA